MSDLQFRRREAVDRFGVKGPGAEQWLTTHGIPVPAAANTWTGAVDVNDDGPLVARLGTSEFFLEDPVGGGALRAIEVTAEGHPVGVYPVPREDSAFLLSGDGSLDALAQVCNIDFGALDLGERPVLMTSMAGVSVLIVPLKVRLSREFRIWCDPTFGPYLGEAVGTVVAECGGYYRRESE